jgi:hypothetical protein
MISLKFRLTEEEYYQFNYFTAWADPRKKQYRINYFLRVILLYGAVAFLYIFATRTRLVWIDISVFVITGMIYLFMVPFFVKRSVRRKVAEILSRRENHHILEESEIILSPELIIDRDTVSESRYSWEAIVRYAEYRDAMYLYTNSHHAIVIPKRVTREASVEAEAESLINGHLPLHA